MDKDVIHATRCFFHQSMTKFNKKSSAFNYYIRIFIAKYQSKKVLYAKMITKINIKIPIIILLSYLMKHRICGAALSGLDDMPLRVWVTQRYLPVRDMSLNGNIIQKQVIQRYLPVSDMSLTENRIPKKVQNE